MSGQWIRVTRREPCRVCQKPDWCTVSVTGSACCMRVESPRPMANGGWLHHHPEAKPPTPRQESHDDRPEIDAAALMSGFQRETTDMQLDALAESLGLPRHAVDALAPGWARRHSAWAFPMRDGQGGIVGIRLRNDQGRKWAVTGSRSGIFVPTIIPQDHALICEGPTDTAAALAMGYFALGRPSCSSGFTELATTCVRLGIKRVVVVADNDGPGRKGAEDCGAKIGKPFKIFMPPTKDIRALYRAGGRREFVEDTLKSILWRMHGR